MKVESETIIFYSKPDSESFTDVTFKQNLVETSYIDLIGLTSPQIILMTWESLVYRHHHLLISIKTGTNAKTKQKGCVTSPLEDWTDEATIAWKKTYFANVKKRKKTKVNHFACCTGQGLSIWIHFYPIEKFSLNWSLVKKIS